MPDQQNPNDPSFDWLFTGDEAERPERPEHPGRPDRPETGDPAPTRSFGYRDPAAKPQPADDATPRPTSFGGVYAKRTDRPQAPARPTPPPVPPAPQVAAPAGVATASRYAQPTSTYPGGTGTRPPMAPGGPGEAKPPGQRSSASPPSKPRRRIRWVRIVLAILLVWLLFLVIAPLYAWSKIAKVDADPSGARPAQGPGTNYLLVGSDSRAGLSTQQENQLGTGAAAGQRTDTIILLHVSDGGGPNVLLSIPRDSYVSVPGHGMQKVNAAFAYGGPKLLVQTIEQATGVRVDDYIQIGFTGVVDVVNAVGGITVCPKTPVIDPKAGHIHLSAGCHQVNGQIALDYTRSRAFPLGDIIREQHQREVIGKVGSAAASWKTIAFPWRYWGVLMAGAKSVTVGDNVGPIAFAKFAWAMKNSGSSSTKRCVVPYSSLGTTTAVGSVVVWDKTKATAIFNDVQNDDTSAIHCTPTGQ